MAFYRGDYVTKAEQQARARSQAAGLGKNTRPVVVSGTQIVKSFWGKAWCQHLESFSDYANRLPRGRTYVRNGSVCDLAIEPGRIRAQVSGSHLYQVTINVTPLAAPRWEDIKARCSGQIASLLELLEGRLSDQVLKVVTDRQAGLFPQPAEIKLKCSCPDWASMCKHVAAALYGVGNRLDSQPDLLFLLRQVDPMELFTKLSPAPSAARILEDDRLSQIFGIDLLLD